MAETSSSSVFQRTGLLLGALLLCGVLLEGGARLALWVMGPGTAPIQLGWEPNPERSTMRDRLYRPDPDLFFRLQPDLTIDRSSNPRIFDVHTDERGLRGEIFAVPKPSGALRVLAIGDSCTFGSGAGQADTYPAQLENRLRKAHPGRSVEVVNAGVPGFSSYQAIRFLDVEGWSFEPDVVVIATGINDAHPANTGSKRRFGADRWLSDREYAAALNRSSVLAITRLLQRAGLLPMGSTASGPDVKRRVPLDEYEAALRRFARDALSRGIIPVIVAWPLQSQATPDAQTSEVERVYARYQAAAESAARAEGAAFVPLVTSVEGRPGLFVDPVHMNATGYGLVADAVAEAVAAAVATAEAIEKLDG